MLFQAVPALLFQQAHTVVPRLGAGILALVGLVSGLAAWRFGPD